MISNSSIIDYFVLTLWRKCWFPSSAGTEFLFVFLGAASGNTRTQRLRPGISDPKCKRTTPTWMMTGTAFPRISLAAGICTHPLEIYKGDYDDVTLNSTSSIFHSPVTLYLRSVCKSICGAVTPSELYTSSRVISFSAGIK